MCSEYCVFSYAFVCSFDLWAEERALGHVSAMNAGNWQGALRLAQSEGAVAQDIIEWHRLRDGQGTAQETDSWKIGIGRIALFAKQSEVALSDANDQTILTYFETSAPKRVLEHLRFSIIQRWAR